MLFYSCAKMLVSLPDITLQAGQLPHENTIIAFDEERILILPLLAGSGLMLSCFENFRTGDRLKMSRLHVTNIDQLRFSTLSVWLFFGGE